MMPDYPWRAGFTGPIAPRTYRVIACFTNHPVQNPKKKVPIMLRPIWVPPMLEYR